MTNTTKKILMGAVALIICALGFYFLYWVKTPAYSLNIIREAAVKHDVDTFERHIDLDRAIGKAIDDSLVAYGVINNEDTLKNPFVAALIQNLKPQLVAQAKHMILEGVRGNGEKASNKTTNPKGQQGNKTIADDLNNKLMKQTNELKDVKVISEDKGVATVGMTVFDPSIDGEYTFKLKMEQMADGKWKIIEFTNLVEVLKNIDQLYKAKLDKLNAPIKKELADSVEVKNVKAYIESDNNPYWATYIFNIGFETVNKTTTDINWLNFKAQAVDASGKVIYTYTGGFNAASSGIPFAKGSSEKLIHSKKLNPFVPEDNALKENINNLKVELWVTALEFSNGKQIELLTKIPVE